MTIPRSFLGNAIALVSGSYANRINVSQSPSGQIIGLPAPQSGVITLATDCVYDIHGTVDIGVNRIAMQSGSALIASGFGAIVTSNGGALLTCHHDCVIHNVDFLSTNPAAIFTNAVRTAYDRASVKSITICTADGFSALGEIGNHGIVKIEDCVFRNVSRGFSLVGTIGTALFIKNAAAIPAGNAFVTGGATLVVEDAVALSYCTLDLTAGGTGADIDVGATIPNEGLRITDSAFYGGNAVAGIRQNDTRSFFKANIGLQSTYPRGAYSFAGNATSTSLSAGVWAKVAGATTLIDSERFDHTDNRLTYAGAKPRRFSAHGAFSASATAQRIIDLAVTVNGAPVEISAGRQTASAAGAIDNVPLLAQVNLEPGDYVELWARADAAATLTVSRGVLQLGELG